jgi:hypothetical protein
MDVCGRSELRILAGVTGSKRVGSQTDQSTDVPGGWVSCNIQHSRPEPRTQHPPRLRSRFCSLVFFHSIFIRYKQEYLDTLDNKAARSLLLDASARIYLPRHVAYQKHWFSLLPQTANAADNPHPIGLGAIAQGRICRADGSSGGFCRGWQLAAEVANERNGPFFPGTPPFYVFRLRIHGYLGECQRGPRSQVVRPDRELLAPPSWVAEQPLSILRQSLRGCIPREVVR